MLLFLNAALNKPAGEHRACLLLCIGNNPYFNVMPVGALFVTHLLQAGNCEALVHATLDLAAIFINIKLRSPNNTMELPNHYVQVD